jgi:hypothetical protein
MSAWSRALFAAAGFKLAFVCAAFLLTIARPGSGGADGWLYFATVAEFSAVALLLLWYGRGDARAAILGGVYLLSASPFGDRLLRDHVAVTGAASVIAQMLARLRVDAWIPASIWLFVIQFPEPVASVRLRSRLSLIARAAIWIGAALFAVNLVGAPSGLVAAHPASYYWTIVFLIELPTLPVLLWRAQSTRADERRRLAVFIGGLLLGIVPILLEVLAEALVPPYRRLMEDPSNVRWSFIVVYITLGISPLVTAYSVLVDRVIPLSVFLRAALHYALARYTIVCTMAVPFATLAWYAYTHQQDTIAQLLSGSGPLILLILGTAATATLLLRDRVFHALDKRFFREEYDARQILARLADETRKPTGLAELASHVTSEIDRALHLSTVALLVADERGTFLRSPDGRVRALRLESGLAALIGGDEAPLEVDLEGPRSSLRRLPDEDRQWLADGAFRLLLPLIATDRSLLGLLALGDKLSDLGFSAEDRLMLGTIGASLGLTLENRRLRASPAHSPGSLLPGAPSDDWFDAAAECIDCRAVHPPGTAACACGATLRRAAVPYLLLGKFRFDKRIGSGGMGVVYRAVDLSLDRVVAVKTLPQVSPEHAGRMRREARAMAVVAHPNLALIYGAEMWRGTPMLVCEYLGGGTLSERLRRRRLSADETIALGLVIADVLEHIHGVGIVHCDIKPSNIGFTSDNVPKLLDFGLARIVSDVQRQTRTADVPWVPGPDATIGRLAGLASVQSTDSQRIVGTPLYMAPEAIRMEPLSTSFDLWSACVVLYEALMGTCPFTGPTVLDIHERMERSAIPDVRTVHPDCPPSLATFFADALAYDQSRRPQSAQALRRALKSLQQDLQAV